MTNFLQNPIQFIIIHLIIWCFIVLKLKVSLKEIMAELEELSQYSDGQWDGQTGFNSQQRRDIFLYSTSSRLLLHQVQELFPQG
jgi:hypothetical protein